MVGLAASLCAQQASDPPSEEGALVSQGILRYTLNYSENAAIYTDRQDQHRSSASGTLHYENGSLRYPSGIYYLGGYTWALAGPSYATGTLQRFNILKGVRGRSWSLDFEDHVNYSPRTTSASFLGIQDAGSTEPPPSVFSPNTHSVDNMTSATLMFHLDYATTATFGGSYTMLRFPTLPGLETNDSSANTQLSRRLSYRTSLLSTYSYMHYHYLENSFTSQVQVAQFGFDRKWTHRFSTSLTAGPQWISSTSQAIVPDATRLSVQFSGDCVLRQGYANISFQRSTNDGQGYMMGSAFDALSLAYLRRFGRSYTVRTTTNFQRTTSLKVHAFSYDSIYGVAGLTRQVGRFTSVFVTYTGMYQSSNLIFAPHSLNDSMQQVSFGVSFTPREVHFKN
jgi:hypothetical protein